jgi:hypothetical protein
VSALAAASLAAAASAQGKPLTPRLTATSPPSTQLAPASSTTPQILGEGEPDEEVVTQALPPQGLGDGATPAAVTKHPEFEIRIFEGKSCKGTAVATGSALTLEGSGIAVTVPANSVTQFSAIQVDPAEPASPSDCSNSLSYWEGVVPPGGPGPEPPAPGPAAPVPGAGEPPPAPHLRTLPGGTANDNTPLVAGTAPGAVTVKVFATPQCSGAAVSRGTAAQLAAGLQVQVADNSVSVFSAVSVGPGGQSRCSDPVLYVEDSTAPHTRITMGPASKTRKRAAVFRFTDTTGDAPGTTFLCKVDKGRWKQCSSPLRLRHLRPRRYLVKVKAIDPAGNAETKAAKRRFKVVPQL